MHVHDFGDPDRNHVSIDLDRRTAYLLWVALRTQAVTGLDPSDGATAHEWEALAMVFEVIEKGLTVTEATHRDAA